MTSLPRLSLIIASDKLDKLYPAAILASTSAATNWETELFFTFWGLLALKKECDPHSVSSDYAQYEKLLQESIKSGALSKWKDLLRKAKEMGNVKILACSTTLNMFGIKTEDFEDFVDDIGGASTFLSKAKDSDVNLFIS